MNKEQIGLKCHELDTTFDRVLSVIKQHVIKLPLRSDKQKCALWIKKLCENPEPAVSGRLLRNRYVELLLSMLETGKLSEPFNQRPSVGYLKKLESSTLTDNALLSLSAVSDSCHCGTLKSHNSPHKYTSVKSNLDNIPNRILYDQQSVLPILPSRELIASPKHRRSHESLNQSFCSVDDIDIGTRRADTYSSSLSSAIKNVGKRSQSVEEFSRYPKNETIKRNINDQRYVSQSNDLEDGSLMKYTEPSYTRVQTNLSQIVDRHKPSSSSGNYVLDGINERLTLNQAEVKFHEDTITLQQQHSSDMESLLQRKNSEIEDIRRESDEKINEMESFILELQMKLNNLEKEHKSSITEKDHRLVSLQIEYDALTECNNKKIEEKLQEASNQFDKEKYDIQTQHTRNIQEILDSTNSRLQEMEAQYAQQVQNTMRVIGELERRVQQVVQEASTNLSIKDQLQKNNTELEKQLAHLRRQLNDAESSNKMLETELDVLLNEKAKIIKESEENCQKVIKRVYEDLSGQLDNANIKIVSQSEVISGLQSSLQETDDRRMKQVQDLTDSVKEERKLLELEKEKQIKTVMAEMEILKKDLQGKIKKLNRTLKEKEEEISRLQVSRDEIGHQADKSLADFKVQIEKHQKIIHDDMKLNMQKVEMDLVKSRQLQEKQAKNFARQIKTERQNHDKKLQEVETEHQAAVQKLIGQYKIEINKIKVESEKLKHSLIRKHQEERATRETVSQEKEIQHNRVVGQLEGEIKQMHEDVMIAEQLRRQQLADLDVVKEEEKQLIIREHEIKLTKIHAATEQQRVSLEKLHALQMDNQIQKNACQLKEVEDDYHQKLCIYEQTIQTMQESLQKSTEETLKQNKIFEATLAEAKEEHRKQKKSLQKTFTETTSKLHNEISHQQSLLKSLQNKLERLTLEREEEITRTKIENEQKLCDLLPLNVRKDYEDTISSLKCQVEILHKTIGLLKDELLSSKCIS